jgi:predicted amidophosphoribosyltransferase
MRVGKTEVHESVTEERVCDLAEQQMFGTSNPGICIECGEDADGCEPDAREYECECCGARAVYGAEELLIYV